ncbi:MAG TPA: prolipoprotein diacylglyceryl transferase [Kiritimatiellia bacterium]|nr:prolipoprotein diacylglyceryl transferase [Kiritimatiellia bacterium]
MNPPPYYIHDINPILLPIWGNLAIRWYGLSYIVGFLIAYLLLNRWGKRGEYPIHGEPLQSLIVAIVVGAMVGGRLGYMLFYDLGNFLADPLRVFKLWEGGMASHGGMIGLAAGAWWFARGHRLKFLPVIDGLACAAPAGLGLGRLANFINGELWGRPTHVRWAVIFPQEAGLYHGDSGYREMAIELYHAGVLQSRHPSQLYQAFLEGVVLFSLMLLLRKTRWAAKPGRMCGAFLIIYAATRFLAEFFRAPEIVYFGWLSQGQLLSVAILLPAAAFFIFRKETSRT